ncbi:PTS sugar transporter subunit IIA [Agromyces atrinae]|uniref:BglG family transcription antiterminator n=1 Tax=Agromyces atrinae TaxID=592376 RepID=UPI001F582A36|nr:PTS sugar transporter subunit IIA [Agromyces atrinae]MCI2957829.1 PTS sugar transporter subunit IIA [Agromyces atrinae]
MVDRQQRMLDLLARADDWLTATELAERLGVTARSVRNYVTGANQVGTDPVVESGSRGYRLDRSAYARLVEEPRSESSPQARSTRLLRRLIDDAHGIDVAALALDEHVSDSTIESDVARVRTRLDGSGLSLIRSGGLVRLGGTESARRRLLGALFREESARGMFELEEIQREFPREPLAAFKTGLIDALAERGYEVNEYGLRTVLLHVAIAVDRASRDHALAADPAHESLHRVDAAGELTDLLERLVGEHFDVVLGDGDIAYLGFLLSTRVATPGREQLTASVDEYLRPEQLESVRDIVQRAAREYLVDLDDDDFLVRLALHVQNLVARAGDESFARNPLARSIKSSYPMIYELAVYIAGELSRVESISVNEDEIAYIAMHVGAQLEERRSGEEPIPASIVSPAYHSLHLTLLRRLDDAVGTQLRVEQIVTRSDVDWAGLPGDLVISSIEPAVPADRILVVNPFFGSSDEERVRTAIARARRQRRRARIADELVEYFDERLFFRGENAPDAETMIRRLGDRMVDLGIISTDYVEGALERERLSSTAFTESLAVPHAMTMTATRTAIAIVISETPLPWGESRVNVVAFIAFSEAGRASFQSVFEQFVEVFSERDNVQRLLHRGTDYASFIAELAHLMAE